VIFIPVYEAVIIIIDPYFTSHEAFLPRIRFQTFPLPSLSRCKAYFTSSHLHTETNFNSSNISCPDKSLSF
jgi:hypothetical protein